MEKETRKLEFYGGEWISLLPIVLFIVGIAVTTFIWGSISDGALWVPIFLALVITFFLAKDKRHYSECLIEGMDVAFPICTWLFAGVFSRILRMSGFAAGLAGLANSFGVGPVMFTVISFIAATLFSTATGTGFGTIAEIEALRHYLNIQNFRYSDRLTVDLDIDESFYNMDVPKLLIQPIVENAIIHGLEPKIDGGSIRIWAELAGDDFLIHVEDDGVGMTEEVQRRVLSGRREQDYRKKSHIGIYNVHRRSQLFYGEEYGLEIRSAPGAGTCITMRIRALREPAEGF